ncbi:MAG: hypothetical protein D6729_13660 [Deltaproteobacteria bacterium]|nr:MAG: hypothetical protein D6729_13660 [Deltaproteobacteria bacterium]
MKELTKLLVAAALASLLGCGVSDESMVVLVGAIAWQVDPNAATMSTTCTADPNSAELAASGLLDVNYFGGPDQVPAFRQKFKITNQLPQRGTTDFSLETNAYVMERAVISYSGLDETSDAILSNLSTEVALGTTIAPQQTGGLALTLVPRNIAQVMRDQLVPNPGDIRTVIANVQIQGHTVGQEPVDSSVLSWPLDVCNDCKARLCTPACDCSHF